MKSHLSRLINASASVYVTVKAPVAIAVAATPEALIASMKPYFTPAVSPVTMRLSAALGAPYSVATSVDPEKLLTVLVYILDAE
jgi:hypothetical protein